MIYEPVYVRELLTKLVNETVSTDEMEILLVILDIYTEEEINQLMAEIEPGINFEEYKSGAWDLPPFKELRDRLDISTFQKIRTRFKRFIYNAAMALTLAAFVIFFILFFLNPKLRYSCGGLAGEAEIPTGVYSCRLTLQNGCSILIDSTYHGIVATEGNTDILRLESGELIYRKKISEPKRDIGEEGYNIISTASGAQYRVVLPDGSKVRLNAASSIRFPVDFSDRDRVIELTGEAFFEITPNISFPLIVNAGNAVLRVSGTTFNVNSYFNNTVATLLMGSLEIINAKNQLSLKSGEQAIVKNTTNYADVQDTIIKLSQTDTAQIVSWRKALHLYTKMDLKDFVADIGRWYDLDIIGIESVPKGNFSGSFCYDIPLEDVLKIFRRMGMRFRRDGRKIIFNRSS
jgi:transmembrane sensor